jgi:peptidoglycan/xylan/chitin deacetylase (PgdA/CDA1 family)
MKFMLLILVIVIIGMSGCIEMPTVDNEVPSGCDPVDNKSSIVDGPVVSIVFEGGYKTDYTDAYPVMRDKGYRGTCYVIGSRLGFDDYMNWNELGVLTSNGWDIGTAGYWGADMTLLSKCQLEQHLDMDIDEISHKLCYKVTSVVAPYDRVNDTVIDVANGRGIRAILSANSYSNDIVKVKMDGFDYSMLYNRVEDVKVNGGWLIVSIGRLKYCCNADGFRQIVNMISQSGIQVATIDEVLDRAR